MAARTYEIMMWIRDDLTKPTPDNQGRWFIASGEALELWTIKTLCGLYFSNIAATIDGMRLKRTHCLDVEMFDRALRRHPLPECRGMWFRTENVSGSHVSAEPLISGVDQQVRGIRNRVVLFEADTIIDPTGLGFPTKTLFRPWLLRFSNERRTHTLLLTWPNTWEDPCALNISVTAHLA
jgi:hypothetical protein